MAHYVSEYRDALRAAHRLLHHAPEVGGDDGWELVNDVSMLLWVAGAKEEP